MLQNFDLTFPTHRWRGWVPTMLSHMRFFREVLILGLSLSFKNNYTDWENRNCETWKLGFSGLTALLVQSPVPKSKSAVCYLKFLPAAKNSKISLCS